MYEFHQLPLFLASFLAGIVDSIVGGGGLIILPALLMSFPTEKIAVLLGTNKLISFTGTSFATFLYSRRLQFRQDIVVPAVLCALVASFTGAFVMSLIETAILKKLFMCLFVIVFVIQLIPKKKQDLTPIIKRNKIIFISSLIGLIMGFYDGFFGPGTGSLIILLFVLFLHISYLEASAFAKVVNLATNLGAIVFFVKSKNYSVQIALPLMLCNTLGAWVGVKLAFAHGNNFIKVFLRLIMLIILAKLLYTILMN